jgi:gliding motility associated protien GldN
MKRLSFSLRSIFVLLFLFISGVSFAQLDSISISTEPTDPFAERKMNQSDVLDGIYVRQHVPARKPIAYHHLREADVMWKKKIWRMLNLNEKVNHPLYYPTTPMDNRYCLTDLIIYAARQGMQVYGIDDDEFTTPLNEEDFGINLGAGVDSNQVEDLETGEFTLSVDVSPVKPEEITRYMMKEVWFFDKQRSKLEVRILGLCPIRRFINEEIAEAVGSEEDIKLSSSKVCWVYFPAFRPWLANNEVFNPKNDAERRTYDDIFFKRHFSSYVIQETNVYDNRRINQYLKGQDALLEGEKVKQFIFKLEHDLWEL